MLFRIFFFGFKKRDRLFGGASVGGFAFRFSRLYKVLLFIKFAPKIIDYLMRVC